MTPHRAIALFVLAATACLAAQREPAPQGSAEVGQRVARYKPKLRSADKTQRQEAYDAYLREGDEGRKALGEALLAMRKQKVADCRAFTITEANRKRVLKARDMMAGARKEALRVIFDKTVYPDANHGRSGQPVVDKAVATVKTLCPAYRKLFASPASRFRHVVWAYRHIQEIDAQLALCNATGIELNPPLAKLLKAVKPELIEILTVETLFRDYAARCLRYNRLVRSSTSDAERKVVDLTNEYRMQLGIRPLAINERLVRAARKHSAEMAAMGYFGHTSPKPENRTATLRCRNEGYNHFCGENCASGMGPTGAFHGWYNSSGHHRNMINPRANEIGVGHAGPWTEDFGVNPALDLDNPPRRWDGKSEKPRSKPKRTPRPKGNPWETLLPTKPTPRP